MDFYVVEILWPFIGGEGKNVNMQLMPSDKLEWGALLMQKSCNAEVVSLSGITGCFFFFFLTHLMYVLDSEQIFVIVVFPRNDRKK